MILKKLVLGQLATNCYIAGCESTGKGMIVDPADEAGQILKVVQELGLEIKVIVLTHGHPDHIAALKKVKETTGAEIAIHTDGAESLQQQYLGVAFGLAYEKPPPPDRLLKETDKITIGELDFQVMHTPGHSPGSICLLGDGVLFSGDTLFNHGIGRYDLPGGDYSQLMNSLRTRLMALPDETIVYAGHGPDTTIGFERQSNPFLQD